jgi:hypothetical protein
MFLFGCAHVSKKDCKEKNWFLVGRHDAADGKSKADMAKVADSCRRYTLPKPPELQYAEGYEAGLNDYCTNERGLNLGGSGAKYPFICPKDRFPKMLDGYAAGLKTYCIPSLGASRGEEGNAFPDVCGKEKFLDAFQAWRQGLKKFCTFERGKETAAAGQGNRDTYCKDSDFPDYNKGYNLGTRSYCSELNNAYQRGVNGEAVFSNCPSDLAAAFQSAYNKGRKVRAEIRQAKDDISSSSRRISDLAHKKTSIEESVKISQDRLFAINSELLAIDREKKELKKRIADNEKLGFRSIDNPKHELEQKRQKEQKLKSEKSHISNVVLPDLYQQRSLMTLELETARRDKSAKELQIRLLESKPY